MMIVKAYFSTELDMIDLIDCLSGLPNKIRPSIYSTNENAFHIGNTLDNTDKFRRFVEENQLGFFMQNSDKDCLFNLSKSENRFFNLVFFPSARKQVSLEDILVCEKCFSDANVLFSFACSESEYEDRNFINQQVGEANIESWVGRNVDKNLPGLYWITVISKEMLHKHRINVNDLIPHSFLNMSLMNEVEFFCFYENRDDWAKNSTRLQLLAKKNKNIFRKELVKYKLDEVSNYLEYSKILRGYR